MEEGMIKSKDIETIELHFEDGTDQKIEKGFFCEIKTGEDLKETHITFHMCKISGHEMDTAIWGIVELGKKLGIL